MELFDEADLVAGDPSAAPTTRQVACPACGRLGASWVHAGYRRDLYWCDVCQAHAWRWTCCGAVVVAAPPTAVYRAEPACPACGAARGR